MFSLVDINYKENLLVPKCKDSPDVVILRILRGGFTMIFNYVYDIVIIFHDNTGVIPLKLEVSRLNLNNRKQ